MSDTILRQASDAYVSQLEPAKNHSEDGRMRLTSISGAVRRAFVFLGGGPRPGTYVIEATLKVYVKGNWTGSHTLTAKRITEGWKERTITYARQPAVTTTGQAALAVGAKSARDELAFDVTAMVRAAFLGSGVPYFGFRIEDSSTSTIYDIYSSETDDVDLRPRLEISFTEIPTFPHDLVPGDGDVVSIAKPVFRWSYFDADHDEQGTFQVQISASSDFSSPTFDSGEITSTEPELDLSATAYAGITDGGTIYWRVRVTSDEGQISDWSDPVAVTRTSKGTLTINAPASETVDSTPEVVTTLTGRAQRAIAYELTAPAVQGYDPWLVGRTAAAVADGESYETEVPPKKVRSKAITYHLRVRSWDDVPNRVGTPGDPIYAEATVDFQWVDADVAPDAPGALTVTQIEDEPGVLLAWTRPAVPDFWALLVDGELVIDKLDATDVQLDSTHYELTFYGLEPGTEHELEILAIETE